MKSIATQTSLLDTKAALGVIVRFEDKAASEAENTINETLDGALVRVIERTRFKGKARQTVAVDTLGRLPFETVLLVGLGKSAELTSAKLRDAGAAAINEAVTRHYSDVSMDVSTVADEQAGQILVGGASRWLSIRRLSSNAGRWSARNRRRIHHQWYNIITSSSKPIRIGCRGCVPCA